ncbi:nucleotidyltransferase family protein [Chryseobacterium oryctis]|uniref:Sugar phosphate nucleotidyltransferase n=1 Tax=Chryseobacterium oryctis TaxID=2952618 RepID=A0ABT3HMP3_9FLAO|nr:sugar phosphate nucleotidyltransferase [Chryseobacterium oryctis]MCW3161055.1 sugar phosphate nucleotidyltransferase [Chryseobacterium oryctis]
MNSKKTLLILAGGLGSRYKGLKQIDGILENNSPLLEYSIYDALEAGFNKIVVIINRFIPESYLERLQKISADKNFELHWVYQDIKNYLPENFDISERQKPWGTGHAILCAQNIINEPFIMINADDFYGKEAYQLASKEIDKGNISEKQFELIAYPVESTLSENGTVARGICTMDSENFLIKIEEQTSIRQEGDFIIYTEKEKDVEIKPKTLVSMNFFIFHPKIFSFLEKSFNEFINSKPSSTQEFYIPSVVQKMINEKEIQVLVKPSPSQWMGMTYANDKEILKDFLREETFSKRYPTDLWS